MLKSLISNAAYIDVIGPRIKSGKHLNEESLPILDPRFAAKRWYWSCSAAATARTDDQRGKCEDVQLEADTALGPYGLYFFYVCFDLYGRSPVGPGI